MNRADVVLLNQSLEQLGNSLLQRQIMAQRNRALDEEQSNNAAQRTIQMQRAQAEESHYNKMESAQENAAKKASEGMVDAWIQAPGGGIVNFKGSKTALDAMLKSAQANGSNMQVVDQPKTKPTIATISKDTPNGRFTFHVNSAEDFDAARKAVDALPALSEKRFKTAPIANMEAYNASLVKEQAFRAGGNEAAADNEKTLRERFFPRGNQDAPEVSDTEKIEKEAPREANPGSPGSNGIMGFGAKPAVPPAPAVPGHGEIRRTIKYPRGVTPPAPGSDPGTATGKFPTVSSQQDFDALPKGATYINKGKTYVKP